MSYSSLNCYFHVAANRDTSWKILMVIWLLKHFFVFPAFHDKSWNIMMYTQKSWKIMMIIETVIRDFLLFLPFLKSWTPMGKSLRILWRIMKNHDWSRFATLNFGEVHFKASFIYKHGVLYNIDKAELVLYITLKPWFHKGKQMCKMPPLAMVYLTRCVIDSFHHIIYTILWDWN